MTLDELKRLAAAATPNWYVHCESGLGTFLARVVTDDPVSIEVVQRREDLDFIAASREMVPKLIAVVEACFAEEAAKAELGRLASMDPSLDLEAPCKAAIRREMQARKDKLAALDALSPPGEPKGGGG